MVKSPDSGEVLAKGKWWFERDVFCERLETRPEKVGRFRVIVDQTRIKIYDLSGLLVQNIDLSGS
jgi:hypothetical protein